MAEFGIINFKKDKLTYVKYDSINKIYSVNNTWYTKRSDVILKDKSKSLILTKDIWEAIIISNNGIIKVDRTNSK
jgi:hypothetical protein